MDKIFTSESFFPLKWLTRRCRLLKIGRQKFNHIGLAEFAAWRKGVLAAEGEQHSALPDKRGVEARKAFEDGEAKLGAPMVDAHGSIILSTCTSCNPLHPPPPRLPIGNLISKF